MGTLSHEAVLLACESTDELARYRGESGIVELLDPVVSYTTEYQKLGLGVSTSTAQNMFCS